MATERERLLARRLEELSLAVQRSGAPVEAVSRLLELAAVATAQAIALDLVVSERAGGEARREPPRSEGRLERSDLPRAPVRAAA